MKKEREVSTPYKSGTVFRLESWRTLVAEHGHVSTPYKSGTVFRLFELCNEKARELVSTPYKSGTVFRHMKQIKPFEKIEGFNPL